MLWDILTNRLTWEIIGGVITIIGGGTFKHFYDKPVIKQLINLLDSTKDTNSSIKNQAAKNKHIRTQNILNKFLD